MKALLLAVALICCASCATPSRWYQAEPTPGQRSDIAWGVDVFIFDPMTTDASTVDDLHKERKRVVCEVGATEPDVLLQLCQDKGFDAVTFVPGTVSDRLLKLAEELELPVLTAPAGSEGRRTTTGS